MITVYTYLCFSIFGYYDPDKKKQCLRKQNVLMFVMHLTAFLVMYLEKKDTKILALYLMQVTLLGGTILLYSFIYPKVSRLVVNNMCMLLSIGFIMITRLNYDKAAKQYLIAAAGIVLCLVIPIIIRKVRFLSEWRILYGIVGIVSLAVVVVVGRVSYGAMLGFTVAGINIQPSELVKIVFVFFVASSFKRSTEFKDLVVTTVVAAFHVLILVVSKDLGAALIIFVVYLVMLYVATHQPLYILAGLGAGSLGAVAAYHLFTHVKTRVNVWRDPFGTYDNGGYQVAQSLFAIGTGGWFGAGLYQGQPDTIPVSAEDFIFSAISEAARHPVVSVFDLVGGGICRVLFPGVPGQQEGRSSGICEEKDPDTGGHCGGDRCGDAGGFPGRCHHLPCFLLQRSNDGAEQRL